MLTIVKRNFIRILAVALIALAVFEARRYVTGVHPRTHVEAQRVALVNPRPEPARRPEPEPKPEPAEPSTTEPQPNVTSQFFKFDDYAPGDSSPGTGNGPGGLRDDLLGLDTAGRGGADSYGLVGKHGGKDVTTLGNATVGPGTGGEGGFGYGKGGPMAKFAAYGTMLKDFITAELNRHDELRVANYETVVTVMVGHNGRITEVSIATSTGIAQMDKAIREALAAAAPMTTPPPPDMPQPVHLRIRSFGATEARK